LGSLSAVLGSARPTLLSITGTVVIQCLNQGTLALHKTTSIRVNKHCENKIYPAIPALINTAWWETKVWHAKKWKMVKDADHR
jgi:hypothetical protein